MPSADSDDPLSPVVHSSQLRLELTRLIEHVQAGEERAAEPDFRALLRVSGEVLKGVRAALAHYDEGREKSLHLSE